MSNPKTSIVYMYRSKVLVIEDNYDSLGVGSDDNYCLIVLIIISMIASS